MTQLASVVLLLVALPVAAAAQSDGAARSVALTFDNDLIAVRGAGVPPDYDYTHGAKVAVAWAGAPAWVRQLAGRQRDCRNAQSRRAGCVASVLAVGQEIYTPRRDALEPVPGERPYAGWLSASATARLVAPGRARSLGAEIGVTGPPSLGEQVQGGVHRLLRNEPQLGWANQLPTAPGFALRYGEVRRAERPVGHRVVAATALRWGGVAGSAVSALSAGAEATLGLRGDLPWSPAEPEVERPARLYLLAGYRQDVVLRSVFVDGRGVAGRAVRRPLVGQAEVGAGYRRRWFGVEYRHVVRGREYDAQPSSHAYGSVALIVHGF